MNKIHRLVWSQVTRTWVAVAENARGRGKGASRKLVAATLSLCTFAALGAPAGGQVTAGSGTVTQSGAVTTVNQASPNLSMNWSSFNVAPSESVKFVQPSASSVAVNRILDVNGSQIMGRLSANGQVYLINPNGILFGQNAQVNVGALVASTLELNGTASNTKTFSGAGTGSITNLGNITTTQGGYIALLGHTVSNTGTLNAPQGTVALGGGSSTTLTFQNNSLVGMQIDQSVLNTLVHNGGLIRADGGQVILSAGAKDAALASVVNNTGVVQAQTVNNIGGVITLLAGMAAGTTNAGGTLDASAPSGGDGGFIETSAAHVKIANNITITTSAPAGKTGQWLIDPADFTISAAGTGTIAGATPSGDISNTTLQTALAGSDVIILSSQGSTTAGSGDINVNANVAWSANQLTLTAARHINVNSVMTASGTAKLVLNTATANGADAGVPDGTVNMGFNADGTFKGKVNFDRVGSGFLQINGANYTVVNSLGVASDATTAPPVTAPTLQGMAAANTNFALGGDINAAATGAGGTFGATGFTPIGNTAAPFSYSLNGLGHTIANLTMAYVAGANVGLIGIVGVTATSVGNIGLVGSSVKGGAGTGGLVGSSTATSINNSYNIGSVDGGAGTGGLMGATSSGTIRNSYTTGTVIGGAGTGGLLGAGVSGAVSNSYSASDVTGTAGTGGLVGASTTANYTNVYATGKVSGTEGTGGLVGTSTAGNFTNAYTTGEVRGAAGTGGLVGTGTSGSLLKSYTTGNVTGAAGTGGLIGTITSGLIDQTYALGNVKGDATTGGLAGSTTGTISNSYAMGIVDPAAGHGGLVGASTAPILNSYAGGASSSSVGGLASTNTGVTTNSYWDKTANPSASVVGVGKTNTEMKTVATYSTWDPSIWLIEAGKLPILKALVKTITVTATANNASKTYDGNVYSGFSANYSGGDTTAYSNTDLLFGGAAASATNVGTWAITPYGLTSSNAQYVFTYVDGLLTINPAAVSTLSASSPSTRAYDGTTVMNANVFSLSGLFKGETLGLTGVGSVASKDVGVDKLVALGTLALTNGTGLASNYTLVGGTQVATITPAQLTSNASAPTTRAYDGTTLMNANLFSLSGFFNGETLGLTGVGSVASKDVGVNKAVSLGTLALTNGTGLASNYTLVGGAQTASITPAQLTGNLNAYSKVYDGNTTAAPVLNITGGLIGTETVLATGVATFNSKDVSTANLITLTSTQLADGTGGGLASNYAVSTNGRLAPGQSLGANITARPLIVTATATGPKTYNAITDTTVTLSSNALSGDNVAVSTAPNFNGSAYAVMSFENGITKVSITNSAANFSDKNVGTGKLITVTGLTASGLDAGNYALASTTTTTGTIVAKNITVTAVGKNKVYDASATDQVTLSSLGQDGKVGIALGDRVTFSGTATFDAGKNVGTDKAVSVSGITSSGLDAGNYTLANTTATTQASITAKALTATALGTGRVYDGTLAGAATLSSTGVLSAGGLKDAVGFTSTSALFATKTVGTKAMTVSGIALTGADKDNYTLSNSSAKTTAAITQKLITVSAVGADKVYDAKLLDAVTLSGIGVVAGDTVAYTQTSANFADKNVGTNKTVTVSGIRLSGLDSANYKANTTTTTTASITPKAIVVSATGTNKVYDASLNDKVTLRATGVIGGDVLGLSSTSALFDNKNVGTNKTVTVSGISLTGVNAGNYTTNASALTTATITPKVIVVSATGINKVYDGTLNDEVTLKSTGLIEGDTVVLTKTSALFATQTVGTGKRVSVSGIALTGTDALNYKANTTATTSASITPQ